MKDTLHVGDKVVGIQGNASLLSYIGHDGLMDFELTDTYVCSDNKKRDVIILACYSKSYFSPHLAKANINPIAQFPAEGIVIFGQKTLQVTPSALDRINVRRMMIFVKREISKIASTLLFDQNVDVTWSRFTGQVNPFLATVKSRLGLNDYRVILDKTTTTPDLVDRNIMYAKIFLKPARAIEFIAIDFTITDSGASFID
jgi:hypothetical protein